MFRSPSRIGLILVATSISVLVAPLLSCTLHYFADNMHDNMIMNSAYFRLQFEAMVAFPRIVASGLILYVGACIHCIGRNILKECDI